MNKTVHQAPTLAEMVAAPQKAAATSYRPEAAADFLRHTLLEIDAEAAAFEAAYPGSRGAPGDLDGAFAQLAYARLHVAKALAEVA